MEEKLNKQIIIFIAILIMVLTFWAGTKYSQWKFSNQEIEIGVDEDLDSDSEKNIEAETKNNEMIMIHVFGAVKKPGLYELPKGSRINDALKLAEPKEDALINKYLNRAEKLKDEEPIFVPSAKDIEESEEVGVKKVLANSLNTIDDASGKINLNSASLEELKTLPGIGQVKAEAIVEYRNTVGNFNSTEQITEVSGIGKATLEKIKAKITV